MFWKRTFKIFAISFPARLTSSPCESFLPPPGFGGVHLLSVIENHAHTGIRQRRTSTPRHHWHGGLPQVNKRRISSWLRPLTGFAWVFSLP
jgi:hypothetical protein